jgi:cytochrome P450
MSRSHPGCRRPAPGRSLARCFDPERFAGDHGARGASGRRLFAYIPFGVGQRLCIGRDFAMMEGTLALAMIVQRYRVAAVKGRLPQPGLSATLRPKGGVWAHVAARDRA